MDEVYPGANDQTIASRLGIRGQKISDLLFRNSNGNYLIGESKGGNVWHAVDQIKNTSNALIRQNPNAAGNIQYRIYVNQNGWNRLTTSGSQGYFINSEGYLYYKFDGQIVFETIEDQLIKVLLSP